MIKRRNIFIFAIALLFLGCPFIWGETPEEEIINLENKEKMISEEMEKSRQMMLESREKFFKSLEEKKTGTENNKKGKLGKKENKDCRIEKNKKEKLEKKRED